MFTEVVIAPEADAAARAVLAGKQNLRLLLTGGVLEPASGELTLRSITGGLLVQERDRGRVAETALKVVTARAADPGRARRSALRLRGLQARQVERDRVRQARRHGRASAPAR